MNLNVHAHCKFEYFANRFCLMICPQYMRYHCSLLASNQTLFLTVHFLYCYQTRPTLRGANQCSSIGSAPWLTPQQVTCDQFMYYQVWHPARHHSDWMSQSLSSKESAPDIGYSRFSQPSWLTQCQFAATETISELDNRPKFNLCRSWSSLLIKNRNDHGRQVAQCRASQ